jgi:hypothetical protein
MTGKASKSGVPVPFGKRRLKLSRARVRGKGGSKGRLLSPNDSLREV